jgi:hypothetical protein
MDKILVPGDLDFEITLANIPAYWQILAKNTSNFMGWIYRGDSFAPECVNQREMLDYMLGGEYEQQLSNNGYDLEITPDLSGVTSIQIDW